MEQEKLFELSSWQWNLLQSYTTPNSKESWTALMNDLMIGASDCAVLHRRLRLDEYEMGFADHEESLWVLGWDEMPEITPNQLLANHFELVAYQEDVGVAYAPVISLHTYADSDNLRVRLPCNHESNISAGILKDLSREDCLTAHCATKSCGRQIMDLEDDRLLDLAREREERADWAIDQIDWERRDREVRNGSVTTRTTGKKLYHALKSALASMKVPGSATHAALDATDFAETKIVKRHLRSILSFDNDIDWAPRTVLIELQQETSKTLKAASPFEEMEVLLLMLPPAFEEFLCKWLTRAVNHAFPSSIDMSIEDVEASFAEVLNHIERVGWRRKSLISTAMMRWKSSGEHPNTGNHLLTIVSYILHPRKLIPVHANLFRQTVLYTCSRSNAQIQILYNSHCPFVRSVEDASNKEGEQCAI